MNVSQSTTTLITTPIAKIITKSRSLHTSIVGHHKYKESILKQTIWSEITMILKDYEDLELLLSTGQTIDISNNHNCHQPSIKAKHSTSSLLLDEKAVKRARGLPRKGALTTINRLFSLRFTSSHPFILTFHFLFSIKRKNCKKETNVVID